MRKITMVLLIILITSLTTSCDYKDIDRRIFIVAIGVDASGDGNGIKLSLKVAIPPKHQSLQKSSENYELIEVEADTIGMALRKVKERVSLEPDYSHMKILVLGRNYLLGKKDALMHISSFFLLRRDFQNLMWVAIGEPSANKILDSPSPIENFAGSDLYLRFGQAVNSPYNYDKKLCDLYTEINTPGLCTSIPIFNLSKNKIVINTIEVLTKDAERHITVYDEDIKLFNILKNKKRSSAFIYCLKDEDKIIGFNLSDSKTKYHFENDKDKDLLICNVDVKLKLQSEEGVEYNITEDDKKALVENQIKMKIAKLLEKFQNEKIDPLNLQLDYWQSRPSYDLGEDWLENKFNKIQFHVNVDVDILGRNSAR